MNINFYLKKLEHSLFAGLIGGFILILAFSFGAARLPLDERNSLAITVFLIGFVISFLIILYLELKESKSDLSKSQVK